MRKFLSLALATIMVILAIPLTVAVSAASATTAPTTFPGTSTEIEITSITDGYLTQSGTANVFLNTKSMNEAANGKTYSIFDSATVDLANYSGIMTKVKQTGTGPLYMRWYIKFSGTSKQQYINALGRSLNIWNGTEWIDCNDSIVSNQVWKLPNLGVGGEAYVYLSFDEVKTAEFSTYGSVATDLTVHSYKGDGDGTNAGVFSEWSLVSEKKVIPPVVAPTKMPDGTQMMYKSITDGSFTKEYGVEPVFSKNLQNKTYSIFENGKQALANYSGFLARVESTGTSELYFRLKFDIEGETEPKNMPAASKIAYWYDGENWSELTGAASNWTLPLGKGYVYVSFETMGITDYVVSDIMAYSSDGKNRAGSFSEWSLVYTPEQIITGANVSLTDDLTWNVYANAPDGCTDSKVTFSFMDGNTEATLSNGRYSLTGILPQQVGEDITVTWTGTVNGAPVTDTVTSSVEKYCKNIIGTETQSTYHELAKALLHYGAAAQVRTGYEGKLCNDGIEAVTAPVDLTATAPTLTNNDSAVWTGVTLRLDGALALKVSLTVPDGVTSVTATVEGRNGSNTLDVVDGCVVLSLNAYELSKDVTLSYGDAQKTLVISADYVLKNTASSAYTALAQAVADYGSEAAKIKN